jgi:YD repeat-containing protein
MVCPDPFDLTTCYRDVIPHSDLLRSQDFSYDAVGNRTDLGAVLEPGNRLAGFNGTTLGYDADGNLTGSRDLARGTVGAGEIIGWVGRSGLATGPNLHFEIRSPSGAPINPINCLP